MLTAKAAVLLCIIKSGGHMRSDKAQNRKYAGVDVYARGKNWDEEYLEGQNAKCQLHKRETY